MGKANLLYSILEPDDSLGQDTGHNRMARQYVNLIGEYDFSEEKIRDSVGINRDMILALKLPGD